MSNVAPPLLSRGSGVSNVALPVVIPTARGRATLACKQGWFVPVYTDAPAPARRPGWLLLRTARNSNVARPDAVPGRCCPGPMLSRADAVPGRCCPGRCCPGRCCPGPGRGRPGWAGLAAASVQRVTRQHLVGDPLRAATRNAMLLVSRPRPGDPRLGRSGAARPLTRSRTLRSTGRTPAVPARQGRPPSLWRWRRCAS